MWQLLAIVLGAILLFYWLAFYISVVAWLNAIGHLFRGNFIRASIWFSIGCGMLFWWMSADIDFDTWSRGSVAIVGVGALGTFVRFYNRHRRAAQAVTPFEPAPFEPSPMVLNINIEVSPHADRRAVHDNLAALASALRDAVGTGPRRISGPTIVDQ